MVIPAASSQSVLTGPAPVATYSSTAATAVEKAISTDTLKHSTIDTVISFLQNHGLSENNEKTKSDYTTLTKQMINQTREASALSLDMLKFHLNDFTVVVRLFKSESEQREYSKKLDGGIICKNVTLDHDIYSNERKSAILNDYKNLRNNTLMDDEKFENLYGLSLNNNQQTTALYNTLFLMFINSLNLNSVISEKKENDKTENPGGYMVITVADNNQEEQEYNCGIMKTRTPSKNSSIKDVLPIISNSAQEIEPQKIESASNTSRYGELRQAMDILYEEVKRDGKRIDDILQNKGKGFTGSDIEMKGFDAFTPDPTFFTDLEQCTNNIREKADLLITAFSVYMINTAQTESEQFKDLLEDLEVTSREIQHSNKKIHEMANMPEHDRWISYLEYYDLVSNIRAPVNNINNLLIQINNLTSSEPNMGGRKG